MDDSIQVIEGRLVVNVALTAGHPSASGKTIVFFSTHGNKVLESGHVVGINLYKAR